MSTIGSEVKTDAASTLIPAGLLPSYLADAFGSLYEEDGLALFGKGLGWLSLLACFARFYADVEEGHVSIVEEGKSMKNGTLSV